MTYRFLVSTFELGRTTITPSVLAAIGEEGTFEALSRHAACDWGDLCAEDCAANDDALETGARLLSSYTINGTKIYVITDGETDICAACWAGLGECEPGLGEWIGASHFRSDLTPRRLTTTVLLPREY